jgi:hypothetical protein
MQMMTFMFVAFIVDLHLTETSLLPAMMEWFDGFAGEL